MRLRKSIIVLLIALFIFLSYFMLTSLIRVMRSDWQEPLPIDLTKQKYRLVLISQDIDTPFWEEVIKGAESQAIQDQHMIEVLGNYGRNEEDFLENLELAIHSKVDGIIVQGLDSEPFKELTKIKAAFYSIPIITIANDVPMEESLRRTYVGSDHYLAGQQLAEQLINDMGESGKVVLFYDQEQHYYQTERQAGIENVLNQYPEITIIQTETIDSNDEITLTTQALLNEHPDLEGFIAIKPTIGSKMIEEISRRRQVETLFIYTFDDHSNLAPLLAEGKIDAVVQQSPFEMGRLSVQLIVEWLNGETVPLDFKGYLTNIEIVKAADHQ